MSVGTLLDRMIGVFAPRLALSRAAARRLYARATLEEMEKYTGGQGGYEAGRRTRFTQGRSGSSLTENQISRAQLSQLRNMSWECYRNNSHARKICRAIESRTLGRDPHPQSMAVLADGSPNLAFRARAEELWRAASSGLDVRGRPGEGGLCYADLARVALRGVILSGEVLYRFIRPEKRLPTGAARLSTPPPLSIQLIRAERLDESLHTNEATQAEIHHGIEVDEAGRRKQYWIQPSTLSTITANESVPVSAEEIRHLFVQEDVDQLRGVPWFAPALFKLRDIGDYEFHELQAAAMAACVVLGYRKSSGQTGFGVDPPSDWDVTDPNGNPITSLQPGMLMNLGATGEIDSFNPQRPNSNAVEFLGHELRAASTGLPGLKGSLLTADYRQSSFASERAAENEAWPEVEILQDWFAAGFSQPIYDQLVILAVQTGWFEGTENFTAEDFVLRRDDYLRAQWQGPTPRSINPVDDAEAAAARVRAGISSPYMEASKVGVNLSQVLEDNARFVQEAEAAGMSEDFIQQVLGITQQDTAEDDDEQANQEGPKLASA